MPGSQTQLEPVSAVLEIPGGRAAEPVGCQRGERTIALDGRAEGSGEPRRDVVDLSHPLAAFSHSSGSDVTSPAPRVMSRSPGRVRSGSRARMSDRFGR